MFFEKSANNGFAIAYLYAFECDREHDKVRASFKCFTMSMFLVLFMSMRSRQIEKICYDLRGSRKCTLKTKYGMLLKYGRSQNY